MGWDHIIELLPTYGPLGIGALVLAYAVIILDRRITERDLVISKLRDERSERLTEVIGENTQSNHELVKVIDGLQRLVETLTIRRRS